MLLSNAGWSCTSPAWLPDGHTQTIWSAKVASRGWGASAIPWQRERWTTPDHDFIDVDVFEPIEQSVDQTLVLFHGLEGSSASHYAQGFARVAQQHGLRLVVPHFRGCSGEINVAPRAYHSGDHAEIDWLLKRMHLRYGRVHAVGISLGGNALMHWAGVAALEASEQVLSVCSVGSPLDLVASGKALATGLNRWIYTPMFLRTMKRKAQQKHEQFPGLFDLKRAMGASTLIEFDDAFTAPVHGFDGVWDYWTRASAKPLLKHVQVPALCLNACNDPFVPAQSLPVPHDVSEHVTLWQPSQGGHVGFVRGHWPWATDVLCMPQAVVKWAMQHHDKR